ncbi:MAG: GNAT family N-acetyltransferase [Armatimonadetes bacterium 55-13]|nr:MAG: GNAT family N-acetyltransferase [Armatimonadetes bacterium 55-13]
MIYRAIERKDCLAVVELIRELAVYEKLEHLMEISAGDLERDLFGENPVIRSIVAERESEVVGYAIFFRSYSTFLGKAGIWLEDLYVKQSERGGGIGKRLLQEVGKIARAEGAGRLEWSVLDWNDPAIGFYRKLGADILGDWRICRLDSDGIENLTR